MTVDTRFSLELLSKIEWAQESPQVLEFFNVLDNLISDDELEKATMPNKNWQELAPTTILRSDLVIDTTQKTNQQIIKNFPAAHGNEIEVPQVL